jgi:putative membrane protein
MDNSWTPWAFVWIIIWAFIWPLFWMIMRKFHGNKPANKTPLDFLKERYIKGEITKQEFEEKKRDIA